MGGAVDEDQAEPLRRPGLLVRRAQHRRGILRADDGHGLVGGPVHHQDGSMREALGMGCGLACVKSARVRGIEVERRPVHREA